MVWQFPKKDYCVYSRNPLDTVVAQIRFEPILRISAGDDIPKFQDAVRESFPSYAKKEIQNIELKLPNQVEVHRDSIFEFTRKSDGCEVKLGKDNVSITTRNHASREQLIQDIDTIIAALESSYAPIVPTRLGVRYINIVNKESVAKDLGRNTTWERLIKKEYLQIPAEIASLESTLFYNEITSPLDSGLMTLRYGMPLPKPEESAPQFRFDMDRYTDGHVDMEQISETMKAFTSDIYDLFHTFPGIDLMEWMSNSGSKAVSQEVH